MIKCTKVGNYRGATHQDTKRKMKYVFPVSLELVKNNQDAWKKIACKETCNKLQLMFPKFFDLMLTPALFENMYE